MPLPSSLDAIYIINLESDVERRQKMEFAFSPDGAASYITGITKEIKYWKAHDGRHHRSPVAFKGN
eukprot:24977-Eustigmatos_ZCMA.PRE.1